MRSGRATIENPRSRSRRVTTEAPEREGSKVGPSVSGLLKLAIAAQVTTQVVQKAGTQCLKGQEAVVGGGSRQAWAPKREPVRSEGSRRAGLAWFENG